MRKKKKFLNYIDSSEYVTCAKTDKNENDEVLVFVVFHENATQEITEFVCEKAEEYDFFVRSIDWNGGAIFKHDDSGFLSL